MTLSPNIIALAPTPGMKYVTSSLVISGSYFKHQHAGLICYQLSIWAGFCSSVVPWRMFSCSVLSAQVVWTATRLDTSTRDDTHLLEWEMKGLWTLTTKSSPHHHLILNGHISTCTRTAGDNYKISENQLRQRKTVLRDTSSHSWLSFLSTNWLRAILQTRKQR